MIMHVPPYFRTIVKKYKIPLKFLSDSTGFAYPTISNALSQKTPSSLAMAKSIFRAIEDWMVIEISVVEKECHQFREDLRIAKEEWKKGEGKDSSPPTLQ